MAVLEGLDLGSGAAGPGRIHKSVPSYGLCHYGNTTLEAVPVFQAHNPKRRVPLYATGVGIKI